MQYNFCPTCHKVTSVYNNTSSYNPTLTGVTSFTPFTPNYVVQPDSAATVTQTTNSFTYTPAASTAITYQQPLAVEFCTCPPVEMVEKSVLNAVYTERNKCVSLLVKMALQLGLHAGIGLHEDREGEAWDEDWRYIAFIDLPSGQVSWHLHDSEMEWFEGIPTYTGAYDGHSFTEKYERVLHPLFHNAQPLPSPTRYKGATIHPTEE